MYVFEQTTRAYGTHWGTPHHEKRNEWLSDEPGRERARNQHTSTRYVRNRRNKQTNEKRKKTHRRKRRKTKCKVNADIVCERYLMRLYWNDSFFSCLWCSHLFGIAFFLSWCFSAVFTYKRRTGDVNDEPCNRIEIQFIENWIDSIFRFFHFLLI